MQFNPENFEREVAVNWQTVNVLGRSNQGLDYTGTNNNRFSLELFFLVETPQDAAAAAEVIPWLESLAYPPETSDSLIGRRPPRLLVVWPNTFAFTAVLRKIKTRHERFNREGTTIQWRVNCDFEEVSAQRLTQELVRDRGPLRATGLATGD